MSQTQHHNKYWLALIQIPRLATHLKIKLIKQYGLIGFFHLKSTKLQQLGLSSQQITVIIKPNWEQIDSYLMQCEKHHIEIVSITDSDYPKLLQQTHNPPIVLFIQGNKALLNSPQVAVVGSRAATISALEQSKRFAYQLCNNGFAITSGLALGVDSASHRGALLAKGHTIAVVATGLDIVYPARNKLLAKQILESDGLIVSEFLPMSKPHKGNFPRRNRIVTGLSVATLVVEAGLKSGSLISAQLALEQNREVFAVPGSINNPLVKGCHQLIKQGATLVDEVQDILCLLKKPALHGHIDTVTKNSEKLEEIAQQDLFIDSLLSSVDYEATSVDRIVSRCQLPTEEVLTRLITLELKGLIAAVPGGYIRLN